MTIASPAAIGLAGVDVAGDDDAVDRRGDDGLLDERVEARDFRGRGGAARARGVEVALRFLPRLLRADVHLEEVLRARDLGLEQPDVRVRFADACACDAESAARVSSAFRMAMISPRRTVLFLVDRRGVRSCRRRRCRS